jgi:hypothetical protein
MPGQVRTVTLIHGLSEPDKYRTVWACIVGGVAAAESTAEKLGSFAMSFTHGLFEPTTQERHLEEATNSHFAASLFAAMRMSICEAGLNLSAPVQVRLQIADHAVVLVLTMLKVWVLVVDEQTSFGRIMGISEVAKQH